MSCLREWFVGACAALCLVLAGPPAFAADAPVKLPDTAAGRHAGAWLAAVGSGDEAVLRGMLEQHLAASALAGRPLGDRIARLRDLGEREGSLTPVRVVEADQDFARIVVRNAHGGWLALDFECEAQAPFGLLGVRVDLVDAPEAVEPRGPALDAAALAAKFDSLLSARAAADAFSGVVLLARRGTPVFEKAYGLAERRFAVPNRTDTRFNLGSINKIMTKVAVAQLAEAGRLRLDDHLDRWLPDWPQESGRTITIEQLVEHRAGTTDFFNPRFQAMDRSTLRHNRDYVALFRDDSLWFEPGTSQRYSNAGYVLLGEIVAKASGEDYYDYVRGHVLEPAGMKDAGWFEADDPTPNLAMGYVRDEDGKGPLRENVFTRPARGSAAGGGYATAADLLRFEQALTAGKLAGPGWTRWVLGGPRPGAEAPDGPEPPPAFGWAGGAPGIAASISREGEWTLIVLGNLDRALTPGVEERLQDWVRAAGASR
jgi:CubicO group peptidase (beta-lactamase class C family)